MALLVHGAHHLNQLTRLVMLMSEPHGYHIPTLRIQIFKCVQVQFELESAVSVFHSYTWYTNDWLHWLRRGATQTTRGRKDEETFDHAIGQERQRRGISSQAPRISLHNAERPENLIPYRIEEAIPDAPGPNPADLDTMIKRSEETRSRKKEKLQNV